jgi:hypothetical protein
VPVQKLLFAALTLMLMISNHMSYAQTSCYTLESEYDNARNKEAASCMGLTKCQELRTSCTQQIDEYASCEKFKQCIGEEFPASSPPYARCTYEWSGSPSEPGTCQNTNEYWHAIAKSCPGYTPRGLGAQADRLFNCEGHKATFWAAHMAHGEAYRHFKAAIDSGRCTPAVQPEAPKECPAAYNTVSADDRALGGSNETVHNGSRDANGSLRSLGDYDDIFIYHPSATLRGANAQ